MSNKTSTSSRRITNILKYLLAAMDSAWIFIAIWTEITIDLKRAYQFYKIFTLSYFLRDASLCDIIRDSCVHYTVLLCAPHSAPLNFHPQELHHRQHRSIAWISRSVLPQSDPSISISILFPGRVRGWVEETAQRLCKLNVGHGDVAGDIMSL
jgi:hypothetical protein